MFRIAAFAAIVFTATTASADGYDSHHIVTMFQDQPCGAVISAIDEGTTDHTGQDNVLIGAGNLAMAFGFILGFDTAHGGLQGHEETTLVRLREACAASPEASAIELLQDFVR